MASVRLAADPQPSVSGSPELFALALLFGALHFVLDAAIGRCSPTVRALDGPARSDLVIQYMWLITCSPIPVLYAIALPELWRSGAEGRWLGTHAYCEVAMLLHVSSSIYEALVYLVYRKPMVYMVHHAIVVYAYGVGLWVGAMHFWGAWDGLTEASNINLCFLKIGLILQSGRGSTAETVNGMLLYLSFLFVRVLSLPLWLALYAHDVYFRPEVTWHHPLAEASTTRQVCMLTYPVCTLVIWCFSVVWFQPIHKGMLKAMRGKDAVDGDAEQQLAAEQLILSTDAAGKETRAQTRSAAKAKAKSKAA